MCFRTGWSLFTFFNNMFSTTTNIDIEVKYSVREANTKFKFHPCFSDRVPLRDCVQPEQDQVQQAGDEDGGVLQRNGLLKPHSTGDHLEHDSVWQESLVGKHGF